MHKKKLQVLQEQLRSKITAQEAISNLLKTEDRSFKDGEEKTFDDLGDEIAAIEKSIAQVQKLIAADVRAAASQAPAGPSGQSPETKAKKRYSLMRAIKRKAEGKPLDGIELEMHQEAEREMAGSGQSLRGVGVPAMMFAKDDRVVEIATAEAAGGLVGTATAGMVGALRPKLMLEAAGAQMMTGLVGNLDLPVGNALATAAWKTEHTQEHETAPTIRTVELRPNRLTAFTEVGTQMMIQTSNSVETWIRNELSNAIARAVDMAGINGMGASNEPVGILNTDDVHTVELGAAGGPMTRAALVEMITNIAVDNAEVENMAFLMTPETRGQLQELKTDAGSGQFVWPADKSAMLLGYRALVSNLLPKTLAKGGPLTLHGGIFGDFSNLILANWGGADLIVDPYSKSTQAIVRVVVNSFWDTAVVHPEAFSVLKDIDVS